MGDTADGTDAPTQASPEALRRRHTVLRAIRAFFDGHGFTEVETPSIVPSPGLDVHLDALSVEGLGPHARFLHTSPEYQMKRLLARGLPRIYQLCKAFRLDERGRHHNPEFTMLEWYSPGSRCEVLMTQTEALVAHVATALHDRAVLPCPGGDVDVSAGWERLTVHEAFARHADADVDALIADEESFFRVLVERVEPALGRGRPTILYRYPASMASLSRLCDDDPRVCERMEVYVDGIELCNGFAELTDPKEQRARLLRDQETRRVLGKPVYPIDERFLDDLAAVPDSVGNALGIDRLVMLALGGACIDGVMAFPIDAL